jgi:hypothetical protein
MSRRWSYLLLGLAMVCEAGCRPLRTDEERTRDKAFNQNWLDGGGFNNPNIERKKKGLPPLNFDGSDPRDDRKREWDEFFGQVFMDVVVQPIGQIFMAVVIQPISDATYAPIQKKIDRWLESRKPPAPIETAGPPDP